MWADVTLTPNDTGFNDLLQDYKTQSRGYPLLGIEGCFANEETCEFFEHKKDSEGNITHIRKCDGEDFIKATTETKTGELLVDLILEKDGLVIDEGE